MYTVDAINSRRVSYYYGTFKTYYYHLMNTLWTGTTGIDCVFPGVYISDLRMSLCEAELDRVGITHIITAVIGVYPAYPDKYTYITIPLLDNEHEDILSQFDISNAFISNALAGPAQSTSNNKVLIHCMVGASRSATIAAAYIIKETGVSPEITVECMQKNRAVIKPNESFMRSLDIYYAGLDYSAEFDKNEI